MRHRSRSLGRLFATTSAVMAPFGCAGDDAGAPGALPAGAPLAVGASPSVVVGERPGDPDHELFQVRTPFVTPDGRMGVPTAGDATVRHFDRSGEFVGTYGSSGEGPGEFAALGDAWPRGDAVEAFDSRLGRITRFPPGGSIQTTVLEAVGSAQSFGGALPDGGWILYGVESVDRSGRDRWAVHHFAEDGTHIGEIAAVEGFRRHRFSGGSGPDPISPRAIVRTAGSSAFVAETLRPQITELRLDGASRTIVWEPDGHVSAPAAIRAARRAAMDSDAPEEVKARFAAQFDALSGAESVSVFWDFFVDELGFFWVRPYDPAIHAAVVGGLAGSGPGGEWRILDRDGTYLTSVTLPDDFQLLGVMRDEVIGIRRDELDVESVRVYPLERSPGA